MKSLFRCPVCGGPLDREERVLRCAAGHSYDLAKEGYAYLLPPNQKHSAAPRRRQGHGRRATGFPLQRVLYSAVKYAL